MSKQQRTIRASGPSNDKTLEIKYLLRDQKKEMAAIKRNVIFKELMRKPGERPGRQQNGTESGSPRRRGGREDTEAEGQIRMLDGIQDAAKKGQKDQRGVWSPFGKAYRCMGDFEEVRAQRTSSCTLLPVSLAPTSLLSHACSHTHGLCQTVMATQGEALNTYPGLHVLLIQLGYSLPKLERDLMQQESEGLKQT